MIEIMKAEIKGHEFSEGEMRAIVTVSLLGGERICVMYAQMGSLFDLSAEIRK